MADEIIKLFEYFKNDHLIQTLAIGYVVYAIIVTVLCILVFAFVFWRIMRYARNFLSFTKHKKR